MVRLLFDDYGDAHNDIILKVDGMSTFLQVADTYFLGDFLGGQQETRKEIVLNYLEYFKNRVHRLTEQETFVIFDLSDRYIGGFFMTKGKKELIKIQYAWTDKIEGYSTSQNTIDKQVKEKRMDFQSHHDWLLSTESVLQGLDWSMEKIKNCLQKKL